MIVGDDIAIFVNDKSGTQTALLEITRGAFITKGVFLPKRISEEMTKDWPAVFSFEKSAPYWLPKIDPWEQYARALLITNEMMFVD